MEMFHKLGEFLKPKVQTTLVESLRIQLELFFHRVEEKNENGYVTITYSQVPFLNSIAAPEKIDPTLSIMFSQITSLIIVPDNIQKDETDMLHTNEDLKVTDGVELCAPQQIELKFLEKTPIVHLEVRTQNMWKIPTPVQKTLQTLSIENLTDSEVDRFFKEFKWSATNFENLELLRVSCCNLRKIPEDVFTAVKFPKLKILDLSRNSIGVLENIRERPMDYLDVSDNLIEFVDVQFVGSVSRLNIDLNELTALDGIRNFLNLQILSCRSNHIESYQNLKQAFKRLYCLKVIHLEGNPIAEDDYFLSRMIEYVPAVNFGIECHVNGLLLDKDPHKFVNTKPTISRQQQRELSPVIERRKLVVSMIDDVALSQIIEEKVDDFRKNWWDMTEEEYVNKRELLKTIAEKVNKAIFETEYSPLPDLQIFPYSTFQDDCGSNLVQSAMCRKQKRSFVVVGGVKESGVDVVVSVPVVSTIGANKVVAKVIEIAKELENDEENLKFDRNLFGTDIDLMKLIELNQKRKDDEKKKNEIEADGTNEKSSSLSKSHSSEEKDRQIDTLQNEKIEKVEVQTSQLNDATN
ncbi:hypothetical protein EIN_056960 [Entamoeba invadens IP1]|uniref:hypothetical protein n=1 Tax=Entamoeba invadens IP1 TaxID=370355 RepID=UPI0002C3F688|nr:hypothetical protein EIN_056960 [Entamoeba invadens IP1]ELP93311.1 hypothetical protein EIN_056960 [Entamoeba invadens IP1]|eukprot:XP_004260082.1 hypothetical protein EIN_056960 [Entamoeba invadens IP1]